MERAKYEKQLRKFLDKQLKKVEWFPDWSRHYFDVAAGAVFFILDELVKEGKIKDEKLIALILNVQDELNKVEALVNNEKLQESYEDWKLRFKEIKEVEVINNIDEFF